MEYPFQRLIFNTSWQNLERDFYQGLQTNTLIITWCSSLVWASPLDLRGWKKMLTFPLSVSVPGQAPQLCWISLRPPWQRWCHLGTQGTAALEIWLGAMSVYILLPPEERGATLRVPFCFSLNCKASTGNTRTPNWAHQLRAGFDSQQGQ